MIRTRTPAAVLIAAAALAACGPSPRPPAAKGEDRTPVATDTGYLRLPELTGAVRQDRVLRLSGLAVAGAQVTLAAPDGSSAQAVAGGDGIWSLTVPAPVSTPAMYAISARIGERVVRGEGAIVALPAPGPPAVLARAGFAALPLGGPLPVLTIVALDYDAGGGAAVAGLGPAGARVRLGIDGVQAGLDQADSQGRFAVLGASVPLEAGKRLLQVETQGGRAQVTVDVSPAAPLGRAAFRATRQPGGWRLDWARAGGGVQTTLVFDAPP